MKQCVYCGGKLITEDGREHCSNPDCDELCSRCGCWAEQSGMHKDKGEYICQDCYERKIEAAEQRIGGDR